MSKVLFITVQNYTSNSWINEKMLQYTHANQVWWSGNKYECVIVKTYDEIEQYLDKAEWLVVQTAGDTIVERTHLWNKLHSIPDDIGLIGHLVWYPQNATPHLHPQCFILRTSSVKGLQFEKALATGYNFKRSLEDMHSGNAPAELFLTDETQTVTYEFGAKILEEILINNYRTVNFDWDWRFGANTLPISLSENFKKILNDLGWPQHPSRGFCYPENSTDLFEVALKDFVVYPELDISQQLYIELIKKVVDMQNNGVVNILNWDSVNVTDPKDHVICPAGGFTGELTALATAAKRITFYDINQNTLDFKKSLYTEWDGKNYLEYAETWAKERGLITEPRWNAAKDSADTLSSDVSCVIEKWDYFKSLEVEFVYCNIISDTATITNCITSNSIIHTSTILNYYPVSMISHTKRDIDIAKSLILDRVNATNSIWTES